MNPLPRILRLKSALAFAGVVLSGLAFQANALSLGPYTEAYVFGDSISDNGNVALAIPARTVSPYAELINNLLVALAPYDVSDRFSNGPVWTDMAGLTPSLLGGTNFAFGGAESGLLPPIPPDGDVTITDQVGMYALASGGVASPDALYVVAPVGNDLRRAIEAYLSVWIPTGDAASAGALASGILMSAVGNVEAITRQLHGMGARHLLVSNGADLGLTPSVRLLDLVVDAQRVTDVAPLATALGLAYADMLNNMLDALLLELPMDLKRLDIFGLMNDIVADPLAYGLSNVSDPCIVPGLGACANPGDFLFWDGIHLTSAGQAILATAVREAIPLPVPLALVLAGALAMRLRRHALRQSATA